VKLKSPLSAIPQLNLWKKAHLNRV